MNINNDNYEAYLLDYMDGNLSPDAIRQLKAFVAAQGLDWDELTEELPRLEAPAVTFGGKESLKKQRAVVPLYVKVASAAAAAGLLLTFTLWPEKQLPKVEPIAQLKPIEANQIETSSELTVLPVSPIRFMEPRVIITKTKEKPIVPEKVETPLLAELPTKNATTIPTDLPLVAFDKPDFDLLAYQMNTDLAFALMEETGIDYFEDREQDLSLIGKAIFWMTRGQHTSFGSLIGSGLHKAKQNLSDAATDFALATYQHADERFEETKERWEEKHGE
jgi:hypothetical protein